MTNFGQYRTLIEALKGNANGSEARVGAARAIDVYNRSKSEEVTPPLPSYSDTSDFYAFIRCMSLGQEDIDADITSLSIPFLYAWIRGYARESTRDLYGNIFGTVVETIDTMFANVRAIHSTSTEPLTYTTIILGAPYGASIIRRLITTLPDITGSIYGWDYSDLSTTAYVFQRQYSDLEAIINIVGRTGEPLYASIISTYTNDFYASLSTIPYVNLLCGLTTIPPSDITTTLIPIPPRDLYAFGGGHYPEDISAYLQTIQPVNLEAVIRAGYTSYSDVTADATAYGGYSQVLARIRPLVSSTSSLNASITVKISFDLRARLHSWALSYLSAYIYGTNASSMQAYIRGYVSEEFKDLPTFIRPGWGSTLDLSVTLHGWISAHTSDKAYNYDLLPRPAKIIFLAHSVGLTMLRIEPIRGYFPDLHATIVPTPFSRVDLRAFIRPTILSSVDIGVSLYAVMPVINITKIPINFSNVSDMSVYISAFSGYSGISGNIKGTASVSTSTAPGSGWVYVSYGINFYLGTNKGFFVPNRISRYIRRENFVNNSPTPDLWAYARGWAEFDLSASISVYPTLPLYASITGQDLSHVKTLSASIVSTYVQDLSASITGSGYITTLSATISSSGATSSLGATISPYLKILGFRFIAVETKPFLELRAVVNPISSCFYSSGFCGLSAFIRGTVPQVGGYDLCASIVSLSDCLNLSAEIIGRKLTKIKTINIWFRSQTRSSYTISSLCIGVGNGLNSLTAYIKGIPHTEDLYATIVPYRHAFNKIPTVENIKIYRDMYTNAELYKTLEVHFSSQAERYIYDSIVGAIYETESKRWVLNLSELTDTGLFFDRSVDDRTVKIDSILEYDSIDEAIRAAIVYLTERRTTDLTASITATGGYSELTAYVEALRLDRYSDLRSSLMPVTALPDLYASINAYGGYKALFAYLVGQGHGPSQIDASIRGVVYDTISATIVGVT